MKELKAQFTTALLLVLTAAAVIAAAINLQQQNRFRLPDDGVTWMERGGRVEALHVAPGSPAAKAGIRAGDRLKLINGAPVQEAAEVARILVRLGSWSTARYKLERGGVDFETKVYIAEERTLASGCSSYSGGATPSGRGISSCCVWPRSFCRPSTTRAS
jgi:S1-C subfamily serine protease